MYLTNLQESFDSYNLLHLTINLLIMIVKPLQTGHSNQICQHRNKKFIISTLFSLYSLNNSASGQVPNCLPLGQYVFQILSKLIESRRQFKQTTLYSAVDPQSRRNISTTIFLVFADSELVRD